VLDNLFNPKSIALVGASNHEGKIGNTILQNLLYYNTNRKIFPINLKEDLILGLKAYRKVSLLPLKQIDVLIVAVPKVFVYDVLKDASKKKIKYAIIISSGFKESGDLEAEKKIVSLAKRNNIRLIGPNVLGMLDNYSKFDSLFLPIKTQNRPKEGSISLISQSGTVGAILLEQFEKEKIGMNFFVSYGNASDINECDLLEYAHNDDNTKVIACYIEEIIDGKRFLNLIKKIKKPLIILKAGKGKKSSESIQSHTGNLAGDYSVYKGIFKQFNVINANNIHELINYSKAMLLKKIKNVTIITNGGGYGILLSDALEKYNVPILEFSDALKSKLKKELPFGVGIKNPIDIMGDAGYDRYLKAIELTKTETDTYIIILLGQTTSINRDVVKEITTLTNKIKKNVLFISTMDSYSNILENGHLVFEFPEDLAEAISVNIKR